MLSMLGVELLLLLCTKLSSCSFAGHLIARDVGLRVAFDGLPVYVDRVLFGVEKLASLPDALTSLLVKGEAFASLPCKKS